MTASLNLYLTVWSPSPFPRFNCYTITVSSENPSSPFHKSIARAPSVTSLDAVRCTPANFFTACLASQRLASSIV
jgi:hypothetical protein